MLERPFLKAAELARKVQEVATRVALSAAKFGDKASRVAVGIQARAAERQRARAIRALPKRPSIVFLRELKSGQMNLTFYRSIDHRHGNRVREFWALTRDTGRGRQRLATGSMDEFKDFRAVIKQAARQDPQRRPRVTEGLGTQTAREPRRAQRQQEANRTSNRQESRQAARPPRRAHGQRETPRASDRQESQAKTRYLLVWGERINKDGTISARVVRSFNDVKTAQAERSNNWRLALMEHTSSATPRRGDLITVNKGDCPELKYRFRELEGKRQPLVNGHALGAPARRPALTHDVKQKQSIAQAQ